MARMTRRTIDGANTANDERLQDALVQTSYAVVNIVSKVAAQHELSLTLLRVLGILRDRTPAMSELAEYLGIDHSSATGLVDRAVARGFVRKISDEQDRRSIRVAPTDQGQILAKSCSEEVRLELEPRIARLSPARQDQLARLLEALDGVSASE
jgi:DNA-binding MarR family transcriptional regulator